MDVQCTKQFRTGKVILLPGEACQAIYTEDSKSVNLYKRHRKVATVSRATFKKFFKIGGGDRVEESV